MTFETFSLGPSRPKPVTASGVEGRTITDGIDPGKVVIYPHGYSVRIKVHLDKADAEVALGRCGWSPTASAKVWKTYTPRGGKRRWVMRGSAWLTQRAPSNFRLPMAQVNRSWLGVSTTTGPSAILRSFPTPTSPGAADQGHSGTVPTLDRRRWEEQPMGPRGVVDKDEAVAKVEGLGRLALGVHDHPNATDHVARR